MRGWVRDTAPILLSFTLTEIAAILGRLIIKAPHQAMMMILLLGQNIHSQGGGDKTRTVCAA